MTTEGSQTRVVSLVSKKFCDGIQSSGESNVPTFLMGGSVIFDL